MRIVLLLFLVFFLTGCHLPQNNLIDRPKAEDPYSWDFGQARQGVVLRYNFVLKNESKNILNIKEINTSCGCAVSQVKKKTLLPGESTLIEVKFDTKGYSGVVQQYIYVHTDNLENPILKFTIKAEVLNS